MKSRSSRRQFLQAAAVPALGALQTRPRPSVATIRDSSFDPRVEINAATLRQNVAEIHRRAGRPILAVIKNNGYGCGVLNVARALEPVGAIAGFAVVKLHEAVTLRDGGIAKPILLMGPFDARELPAIVARRITPMVYTSMGGAIDGVAGATQRPVQIQVCVDTGIGRVGVPFRQAAPFIRDLAA